MENFHSIHLALRTTHCSWFLTRQMRENHIHNMVLVIKKLYSIGHVVMFALVLPFALLYNVSNRTASAYTYSPGRDGIFLP